MKFFSRAKAAAVGAVAAGAIGAVALAPAASAMYDPHVPVPPFWCPGNGPGISSAGYRAYCEGMSYPDGSRLNIYRVGLFWQPIRCIIPDGSPFPPLAGPGGCGMSF